MPKTYKSKEVIAKFKKLGFVEDRQSGSHKIFYHPKGTLASILRESQITKEEFEKF